MNERMAGDDAPIEEEGREWIVRAALWVLANWRPYLGWLALGLCMALAMLPALLVAENGWLRSAALSARLEVLGPLAVAVGWLVSGWRRPLIAQPAWLPASLLRLGQGLLFVLVGLAVLSQMLGEWLPTPALLWGAARSGDWGALGQGVVGAWGTLAGRYGLWLQGVQENSAARDDLILAGVAGVLIWLLAGVVVLLARRTRQGLLAGLPVLWPLGFLMLYSPADRWLFVTGVALVLLLHLVLDQQALVRRWVAERLDYSPSLLVERGLMALSGFALAVTLAALMPNLYIYELTSGYFAWIQPMNQRMEAVSKRLFPGLAGIVPWEGRGVAGGLPNAFLLSGGSAPGERTVMRVRTNEPISSYDQPPLGHPLQGATFSDYDGLGWDNPSGLLLTRFEADEAWGELGAPRRALLQSVNLEFTSGVIYAAGAPQAPSVAYVAQERFPGDLVALTTRTRSYTVLSQLPALEDAALDVLPAWGPANPLPAEYAIYVALPPTVTPRTRDLAAQLTAGAATPYAAANAIEEYLRQIPYDLEIGPPPEGVTDVADYFLFDLRRGYCDYYATAFVVLARLAGLPARFVTGFAAGNWSPGDQQWVITEAEAHSWPEVYFPQVGWVRFEPTAYRPQPVRIGLPQSLALSQTPMLEPLPPAADRPWLPLWWAALAALPLLAVAWGVLYWQRGHEDPWLGLLRWGRRAGRPLQEGETALEYGDSLAAHMQERRAREVELGRTAAHEVQSLSREVSAAQYGPLEDRPSLREQAAVRWARLRQYLRRL